MKIKSLEVTNFRSLRNQKVENTSRGLILVGKNNSGKSAILNSLRAFFGQYSIQEEDFHRDDTQIEIIIKFEFNNEYIMNFILDSKIGLDKIPSSAGEFNICKVDTEFNDINFNQYKEIRNSIFCLNINEIKEQHSSAVNIWISALKERYGIEDAEWTVKLAVDKSTLKYEYFNKNGSLMKEVDRLLPLLAFIDDDRNFSEEENGKARTITNDLFGTHIINRGRDEATVCLNCGDRGCEHCLSDIFGKRVEELDIIDLEKLLKRRFKEKSTDVSSKVSEYFQKNYTEDFNVEFEPISDVNKSLSISTKIYDNNIRRKVDLANVGAGVRSIYILSLLQAYHELSNNKHILFMIEEPEIYLHPSLQKEMSSILYQLSKQSQVIFTTHSPLMLKNFEIEQIRKVYLNSDFETNVKEANLPELFTELGYSTEDVIGTDVVIFVEGKDDKGRLENIFDKFYNIDKSRILIIDTKSCHNIEFYATLRFLNKTVISNNFLIIRDSDTCEHDKIKETLLNKFRENLGEQYTGDIQDRILVTDYSSFDSYFLNPIILEQLRLVRSEEDFYSKIQGLLERKKDYILNYIQKYNSEERATLLENQLYLDVPTIDKIEDVKRFVRGHDLFGLFGGLKKKTKEYIELSSEEEFTEILAHLDKVTYFRENKKQLQNA